MRVARLAHLLHRLARGQLVGALGDDRHEALQVGADAVDVADAGQDGDEGVVVVAEAHPGVGELAEVLDVERVARLGAVDRDGDDVAVLLVVDRHGARVLHQRRRRQGRQQFAPAPGPLVGCPADGEGDACTSRAASPTRVIEFDPAKAPFQHDGRPGSILDVLLGHGVPLEHACGGSCACTTCHVVVKPRQQTSSPTAEEDEEDMLDKAPGLTPTSRLGCQAVVERPRRRDRDHGAAVHHQHGVRQPWLRSAPPSSSAVVDHGADTRSLLLRVPGGARIPARAVPLLPAARRRRAPHPPLLHRLRPRGAGAHRAAAQPRARTDRARTTCSGSARATRSGSPARGARSCSTARRPRKSSSSPSTSASRPIRPMVRRALATASHPVALALRRHAPDLPRRARGAARAAVRDGRSRARSRPRSRAAISTPTTTARATSSCAASARSVRRLRDALRGGGYARRAVQYERW